MIMGEENKNAENQPMTDTEVQTEIDNMVDYVVQEGDDFPTLPDGTEVKVGDVVKLDPEHPLLHRNEDGDVPVSDETPGEIGITNTVDEPTPEPSDTPDTPDEPEADEPAEAKPWAGNHTVDTE